MAGNVSVQELMGVLQKSGLPFGDSAAMRLPGAVMKEQVGGAVYGQDTQLDAIKNNHAKALQQIAAMDQKLGGLYGDPTSPLFIKNPLQREQLKSGASNIGYRAADSYNQQASSRVQELDTQTRDAISLYEDLVQEQVALEKEAKKAGRGIGSGGGSVKGVSTAGTIKLTKEQKLAGFRDAAAANYWSKIKESDFKREWVQNILSGKAQIPESGYDINGVKKRYESWIKKNPPKGKKASGTGTTRDPLF